MGTVDFAGGILEAREPDPQVRATLMQALRERGIDPRLLMHEILTVTPERGHRSARDLL